MKKSTTTTKTTTKNEYTNPWLFDGEVFTTDDIDKFQGFVYIIINKVNDRRYIGRKYFYNVRKVKNKRNRKRKESDWKEYYGSSDELLEDVTIHGNDSFERHILSLHTTRGDTNIEEAKQQFQHNVLEDARYYNGNINGKWQRRPEHIIESRKMSKERFLLS